MSQSPHRRAPQQRDARPQIDEFWRWWDGAAAGIAASIPAGNLMGHVDDVSERVHAIDPGLAWEFGPGSEAQHQLVVTTEGDPSLRRIARQWLLAAPDADETWEFHDMRQPTPPFGVLVIDDTEIDFADVKVAPSPSRTGLDVLLYHPKFAELSDTARMQVAFLAVDSTLGEEAVELWVDGIETTERELATSVPLSELAHALNAVIAEQCPEGDLGWSLLEGETPQGPVMVMTMNRLSSALAPELDEHAAVHITYSDLTEDGLPGPESLDQLRAFEDHLIEIVGPSGLLVAVESCAGVRTAHFYVDSATPAVAQLEAAVTGWTQGPVTVLAEPDPAWECVAQFRL